MKKNDIIPLKITDVTAEGSGVGKYEGMAVFVPMTAVGDELSARVVKCKKSYAYGIIESIEKPSDQRTEPDCPSFKQCGGCVFRHITYSAERELKQNRVYEVMKRIGGIDMPPRPIETAKDRTRYRNKAQYPVLPDGRVGFYATHSHRIVPCEDCLLQPKEFKKISDAFGAWIRENNISVYCEQTKKGLIRHLYLRKAEATGEIMVVVVINGASIPEKKNLIKRLLEVCPEIKSVQLNINTADTNVILGDKSITVSGADYITDILCEVSVRLSALSFYQVNREMAQRLYRKAAEYVKPEGKTILDLYCGTGTIGLTMAAAAKSIIGAEIVPAAIEDAKVNARENKIENARFICADAADAAKQLNAEGLKPDAVIVDPPRKGCSEDVLKVISEQFCPERIVYISCDPATLARDIAIITEKGYELKEYTPFDLFPATGHVECVAKLCRTTYSSV